MIATSANDFNDVTNPTTTDDGESQESPAAADAKPGIEELPAHEDTISADEIKEALGARCGDKPLLKTIADVVARLDERAPLRGVVAARAGAVRGGGARAGDRRRGLPGGEVKLHGNPPFRYGATPPAPTCGRRQRCADAAARRTRSGRDGRVIG